jgi:hypothetical protein
MNAPLELSLESYTMTTKARIEVFLLVVLEWLMSQEPRVTEEAWLIPAG